MSAISAPFGLRPAYHPTGLDRAIALTNGITSGYNQNLLKGQPVELSGGVIVRSDGTDTIQGAFAGVEFTDTTGRRRVSNYWPANTTGTDIIAYFYQDQQIHMDYVCLVVIKKIQLLVITKIKKNII